MYNDCNQRRVPSAARSYGDGPPSPRARGDVTPRILPGPSLREAKRYQPSDAPSQPELHDFYFLVLVRLLVCEVVTAKTCAI
ncbi:unnamed protein product [Pieris macdunnoughi]|uniref:Uncharacterized protein n=1 Tax=Pieris macdunnoughi TaxID=345717 RepID=A0A821S5P2_9NEOP|nr:unnamed protein product [Pieris macdunnoughi]